MDTILGVVLVLGVMILVHEWGHFIVARFFGVRVDVFSIGFGPRLFGWKRGATDYRVSALPLGGYVRMGGQDLSEVDSGDAAPTGAPDELMSKPRWQRALISFAGPAVNLLMPILLLGGFFWIRGLPYQSYLDRPAVIAAMSKKDPLAKEGVVPGDRIAEINGQPTATWQQLDERLAKVSLDSPLELGIEHQGIIRVVHLPGEEFLKGEARRWYAPVPTIVRDVTKDQPAARAGMRVEDEVVSVDGKEISNWNEFVGRIQESGGKPIAVEVKRGEKSVTLQILPELGKGEDGQPVYRIGVAAAPKEMWSFRKVTFVAAFQNASQATWFGTEELLRVVGKLFSGRLSVKQLQGVVGIANQAGRAVQEGSFAVINLMAVISVNLGVLNLLPIPILDGGNILLLTLESIRRRDFSLAFKERFVQVGLVFILVLFAYVMYNDVVRLLPTHS
jgi:regulator of sigma E protease